MKSDAFMNKRKYAIKSKIYNRIVSSQLQNNNSDTNNFFS